MCGLMRGGADGGAQGKWQKNQVHFSSSKKVVLTTQKHKTKY